MKYALVNYGHVVALSDDVFALVEEMQNRTKIPPHALFIGQSGDIERLFDNELRKTNYSITINQIKVI